MPKEPCNHTSVGMIVEKEGEILLIERKVYPGGFACPAGHVDEGETYEEAAARELVEEVGLQAADLQKVLEQEYPFHCSRPNGDWHRWQVYKITFAGDVRPSESETKSYTWASKEMLNGLVERSIEYVKDELSEEEWNEKPGLELSWVAILAQLGYFPGIDIPHDALFERAGRAQEKSESK